jgi:iron complex outermembrane recepter protein
MSRGRDILSKNTKGFFALVASASVAVLAVVPLVGFAQTAQKDESQLEDIVVTAQKRSESLQDVPIAITSVNAAGLDNKGIVSIADLSSLSAGLLGLDSNGYALPHIRGIGTNLEETGISSAVSVYVDGVYIDSAVGSLFTLNNIDRIEVDKGPQGTLFGRNATGGVIQVITKDPSHEFSGNVSVGEDNYATLLTNLYVTGGLTDTLAADLAVHYKDQMDGWGRNLETGQAVYLGTERDIRSKVLWTPTDRDKVTLALDFEDMNDLYNILDTAVGYVPYDAFLGDKGHPTGNPWDTNAAIQSPQHMRQYGVSAKVQHDFDWVTLTDIAAFRSTQNQSTYDFAHPPADIDGELNSRYQQITEELQLSSGVNYGLKWTAGAFFLNSISADDPYIVGQHGTASVPGGLFSFPLLPPGLAPVLDWSGGPSHGTVTNSTQTTNSGALYGQASQALFAHTDLDLGLRYSVDHIQIHGIDGSDGINESGQSKTFGKPTWRLALNHHFSDDLMSYISYNRGYRAGTYNDNAPELPATQPEVLDAYALGLKSELFNHRLRIDTEGFLYKYKNIVVPLLLDVDNKPVAETTNGPAARLYGLDLDVVAQVTDSLQVTLSAEGLHTEFTNFPGGNYYEVNPTGGAKDISENLTGNQLPAAPKITTDLGATYKLPTQVGDFGISVDWNHNSGWFDGPDNVFKQSAFEMINSQLTWQPWNSSVRIALWGHNLNNEVIYARTSSVAPFGFLGSLEPPRTYGINVAYSFGRQ